MTTMTAEEFELAVYDSWEADYFDSNAHDLLGNLDIDHEIRIAADTADIDDFIAEINELNAITDPRAFR